MPQNEYHKVRNYLDKFDIHFSELDSEHAEQNVGGGLMMMNATNNTNIIPNPQTKLFKDINGKGRVQLCGFVLGKETTCLVYNLYAYAGGETSKEAANITNDVIRIVLDDIKQQPKGPVLIVGTSTVQLFKSLTLKWN